MKKVEWGDIGIVARYEKKEAHIEFEVFRIVGEQENKFNRFTFERIGPTGKGRETVNLDEARTLFKGSIKYDECSHVDFGDENGYIHLCSGHDWTNMMEAMKRVYAIASKEFQFEN